MSSCCPISDYGIIGDGRSAALVAKDGSIDWLCWPRFESSPLFARLLDPQGGHWRIAPHEPATTSRRYLEQTNVLETRFHTASGTVTLTDFMPVASEPQKRRSLWPENELLRKVECDRGEVEVDVHFHPQLDFGRRHATFEAAGRLGYRFSGGSFLFNLQSDAPLGRGSSHELSARVRLRAGQSVAFSLTYAADGPAVLSALGEAVQHKLGLSLAWWNDWASRCEYEGPYRDAVLRSALTLKLLSFAPSGAILAAPTTSLPEKLGGELNWDYRFCWLRDAAFTVRAFVDLGYRQEAAAFVSWLLHATRLTQPKLRVLYDVYGCQPPAERELSGVEGYAQSRPVRVGNAAQGQLQLDVYGEVIAAAARVLELGGPCDRETQKVLGEFGAYICSHWREPDSGLWESRDQLKHYTHSRLMCWLGLDRLLAMHRAGRMPNISATDFAAEASRIKAELSAHGWNHRLGAYTQSLHGDSVDATAFLIALHGMEPATSARMDATYQRLLARLDAGEGLMYRHEQSAPTGEGAFVMCSFWRSHFLAAGGGSLDEARRAFDATLSHANDLGLFAEEIDPRSGQALGNFPQGFSHVGLINSAVAIAEREMRERSKAGHRTAGPQPSVEDVARGGRRP